MKIGIVGNGFVGRATQIFAKNFFAKDNENRFGRTPQYQVVTIHRRRPPLATAVAVAAGRPHSSNDYYSNRLKSIFMIYAQRRVNHQA